MSRSLEDLFWIWKGLVFIAVSRIAGLYATECTYVLYKSYLTLVILENCRKSSRFHVLFFVFVCMSREDPLFWEKGRFLK